MKVTYEFDCGVHEEEERLRIYQMAEDMFFVLWDLNKEFDMNLKSEENHPRTEYWQDRLNKIMENRGVWLYG